MILYQVIKLGGLKKIMTRKSIKKISTTIFLLLVILSCIGVVSALNDAIPIAIGDTVTGALDEETQPYIEYVIDLNSGDRLTAILNGAEGTDFDLYLEDSEGELIEFSAAPDTSKEQFSTIIYSTGTYYLVVEVYSGSGDFTLKVTDEPLPDSGNTIETADDITIGEHSEYLDEFDDVSDFYRIDLSAGESIAVYLIVPIEADYDLYLYDSDGNELTFSETTDAIEVIVHISATSSTYYLEVSAYNGSGVYTLYTEIFPQGSEWIDDNNDLGNATTISSGSITGLLDEFIDYQDYYSIEVADEQVLSITLSGEEDTDFDLAIFDSEGNLADFSENNGSNEQINYPVYFNDTYYIEVSAYSGYGNYTLTVSTNNIISDKLKVSITAPTNGQNVSRTVTVNGTASGEVTEVWVSLGGEEWSVATGTNNWKAKLPTVGLQGGEYSIYAVASDGVYDSEIAYVDVTVEELNMQYSDFDTAVPIELNLSSVKLKGIQKQLTPSTYTFGGKLDVESSPEELYYINLSIGAKLSVELSMPDGADFDLYLYDQEEKQLAKSETVSSPETLQYTAEYTGKYYLKVKAYSGSGQYEISISVSSATVASISAPTAANVGETVTFDGSESTGTDLSYDWDFGDGTEHGTTATVTHSYSQAGTYTVKLTVTDSSGNSDEKITSIVVSDPSAPKKEWTFMVYMDADNDLEGAGIRDINEMEMVGSTDKVNIVVLIDRIDRAHLPDDNKDRDDTSNGDWTDARLYYIEKDTDTETINSKLLSMKGELNMGDPKTLTAFVDVTTTNYPAQRYALILWNHGGATKGIAWDDTDKNDQLTLPEIRSALASTSYRYKFDLIGFDACLMANLEVAYSVKGVANIMVGSEETEQGNGWPYDTILADLTSNPTMDARTLGERIVMRYKEFIETKTSDNDQTQTAIDLSKIRDLATSTDTLANVLNSQNEVIFKSRSESEDYSYQSHVDLWHFANLFNSKLHDERVSSAVSSVNNALSDAVIAEYHGPQHYNSRGMTIYFPLKGTYQSQFAFTENHYWKEFLDAYSQYSSQQDITSIKSTTESATRSRSISISPDLEGDLSTPSIVITAQPTTLTLNLSNKGKKDATNVSISLSSFISSSRSDPIPIDATTLPKLNASESITKTFQWTPSMIGSVGVRAQISYEYEGEKKYKTIDTGVYVRPTGGDVTVTMGKSKGISGVSSTKSSGVSVPVTITNRGGATVSKISATLYELNASTNKEKRIQTIPIDSLSSGEEIDAMFTWNPTVTGNYTLIVAVESKDDTVIGNNKVSKVMYDVSAIKAIKGDLNDDGKVDLEDATMVANMVVGKVPEDLSADFNGNGRVDIGDAAKIAFYVAGKISEL